jgi:hypothetical protein
MNHKPIAPGLLAIRSYRCADQVRQIHSRQSKTLAPGQQRRERNRGDKPRKQPAAPVHGAMSSFSPVCRGSSTFRTVTKLLFAFFSLRNGERRSNEPNMNKGLRKITQSVARARINFLAEKA